MKTCLVNAGHYICFKHQISLQLIWLQNLDAINSESCQDIVFKLLHAAIFDSNLSRHPFLGQVVHLDLLLCRGFDSKHADLFPCCTQKPKMIKRFSKAMSTDLVRNNFCQFYRKWLVTARNLWSLSIKTFLAIKLCQYYKSGSIFSSSKQAAASSNCCWLGNALCLCLHVITAQAMLERCPKRLGIHFAVKTLYSPLDSLWEMTGRASCLNLDSNLNSGAWPTGCKV